VNAEEVGQERNTQQGKEGCSRRGASSPPAGSGNGSDYASHCPARWRKGAAAPGNRLHSRLTETSPEVRGQRSKTSCQSLAIKREIAVFLWLHTVEYEGFVDPTIWSVRDDSMCPHNSRNSQLERQLLNFIHFESERTLRKNELLQR